MNNGYNKNIINNNGFMINNQNYFNINLQNQMPSNHLLNNMYLNNNIMNYNYNDEYSNNIQKYDYYIKVILRYPSICMNSSLVDEIIVSIKEKFENVIKRFCDLNGIETNKRKELKFIFEAKPLNPSLTVAEAGITNNAYVFVVSDKGVKGAGYPPWYEKEINIKFIKIDKKNYSNKYKYELNGLLKLCLLKEIASKLSYDQIKKLPELIICILNILK